MGAPAPFPTSPPSVYQRAPSKIGVYGIPVACVFLFFQFTDPFGTHKANLEIQRQQFLRRDFSPAFSYGPQ